MIKPSNETYSKDLTDLPQTGQELLLLPSAQTTPSHEIILISEDAQLIQFVQSELKTIGQVKVVSFPHSQNDDPSMRAAQLIICDSLADISTLIRSLQAKDSAEIPILILERPTHSSQIRALLGKGISDLLRFPWDGEELRLRVSIHIEIHNAKKTMRQVLDQSSTSLEVLAESVTLKARELSKINRLKDEFMAVLSHELRNPINVISGFSEILLNHCDDHETTLEAAEAIHRNAQFQVKLVQDLMDLSRGLAGKLLLDCQDMEVCSVLKELLPSVQSAARKKNQQLFVKIQTSGLIHGDPQRISQILWNLISNSIKFTPDGGTIEINLQKDGGMVVFTVQDTGVGINREFLPEIFNEFHQQDPDITKNFGGLGLGLAIVKQIVDLHHGTVTAESDGVGRGAVFTVQLPALPN